MKRDCTMMKSQGRENAQAQASALNSDAPKKNHFYSFQSRSDKERSPDVVAGMLIFFYLAVYDFFDLGATLSFVTSLVSMKFEYHPTY